MDSLITLVPDPALSRPSGSEWDFLGTTGGAPLWIIPEIQEFDRPWLGFSTEDLNSSDWVGSAQLTLTGVTGPTGSHLTLFQSGPVGDPILWFATADGVNATDTFNLGVETHAHTNWVFTAPGNYDVNFRITGHHVTDGFKEATGTYTFAVQSVPEPGSSLILATGILMGASTRSRARRTKVSAIATQGNVSTRA